jgi:hypothetical protein
MEPAIGAEVSVSFESVRVLCRITDAKSAYGRARFLVAPLAGNGSQWVELSRIQVSNSEPGIISQ